MWMRDMAHTLRDGLGPAAAKVSTRQLPDWLVRLMSVFSPSLREITVSLGRRNRHTTEKAHRLLGWQPRPSAEAVLDCGRSLVAHGLV
jgi:nucleoside-diphosphate-sugar epimerase